MKPKYEPMFDYVRRCLKEHKGQHGVISRATGIPYFTLSNISRGKSKDPQISTVQKLHDYFRGTELKKAS